MKTHVEFKSDKFSPYEGEEEQINPGMWGKRLAEYLFERLAESGIETEDIIAEDWGWYIPVPSDSLDLAVCVGHLSGGCNEFACFTKPSKPIGRRYFRKYDVTEQLKNLIDKIHTILDSDAEIYEIKWYEPDSVLN